MILVNKHMKIAICDDDAQDLQRIEGAVREFLLLKQNDSAVYTFTSGDSLLLFAEKHGSFDLVFLDILMPGGNGIEVAAEIRKKSDACRIIFLTSSPEFAVASYKVDAFYYLLKDSSINEIQTQLGRALAEINQDNSECLLIREKGKLTRVLIRTIEYLESINHTICFHLSGGQTVSCLGTLGEYQDLLADKRFIRCHKSFIVNMGFVTSISGKDFVLEGNQMVPISRNIYQQVKDAYLDSIFV
jgi:Response regulator of the LytR/AlgR family